MSACSRVNSTATDRQHKAEPRVVDQLRHEQAAQQRAEQTEAHRYGQRKSFSVFPTPRIPLPTMPPDRMTMYDRQPSAMAALMSDAAGSEIGVPRVVAA